MDKEIKHVHSLQSEACKEKKTYPIKYRRECLQLLKKVLKENEKEITEAIYKDFRKSYFEVMENELGLVYHEIGKVCRNLHRWKRPYKPLTALVNVPGQSRVYPIPYGKVLIIGAWNYPIQLSIIPVISALAAGNTVILKPSEVTSHTSAVLAEVLNKAFLTEILYVHEGGIPETTELLKLKFDKIFFTGSTKVGKIVMQAAAKHLTPVTLELGGKNPTIVLADCNIKVTAKRIVWGKFHNGGQACVSPDHVYVHSSIKDELLEEIKHNIRKTFKNNARESESLARIINKNNYNRIYNLIDQEKVVLGGTGDPDDNYIEPTVLAGVQSSDKIMQEEIFGPLLPVLEYNDLDELLNELAERPSPLAMYIFTRNIRKAKEIQKHFRSGGGMINDTVVHFVNDTTPFGGIGDSGMGSYHGKAGFECFSHRKTVIKKPLWFELWVKYPPYTKSKLKIIRILLR